MGFMEILTIVFIVLKLLGVINWSWWLVLLPEIIAVIVYIGLVIIATMSHVKVERNFNKQWNKIFNK